MTTIDLPLNETLEQFIAQRVATGGYANSKEYILAVLEQTREQAEGAALEAKLLEGVAALDHGEGQSMTAAQWQDLQRRLTSYETDPKASSSWEDVKARLQQRP